LGFSEGIFGPGVFSLFKISRLNVEGSKQRTEILMSALFVMLAQVVVGLNFLLSCFLVLNSYGIGWALISFFAVPVGVAIAPFFVGTWPLFLIGVAFFVIGNVLKSRDEKKLTKEYLKVQESRSGQIADKTQTAEVIGTAHAISLFETAEIKGNGKLFGLPNGYLFWLGDDGTSFDMGSTLKSWGKSNWTSKQESKDIFFSLGAGIYSDFRIPSSERDIWTPWFKKYHKDKEN